MTINEELLSKLDSEDILAASKLLESIYVKNEKINISSKNEISIFCTLIKSTEKKEMKLHLFFSIDSIAQKNCFLQLPFQDQKIILMNTKNTQLTKSLFNSLEDLFQKEFLTFCYEKKPELFQRFKQLIAPSINIKNGIIIGKSTANTHQINLHKENLIQQILDPKVSQKDIITYVNSLQSTLSDPNLETLIELTFTSFEKLNLSLSSKESFSSFLKFFEISVQMIILFPNFNTKLNSIINKFLISLDQLNSNEWYLKILNQLPIYILKKCCTNFAEYEKIKDNKVRNIYFKFYNLIKENKNNEHLSGITTAMKFS